MPENKEARTFMNIMIITEWLKIIIRLLTDMLKKTLTMREEKEETLADRGTLLPKRLWRIGRTGNVQVFKRELYEDSSSFVVDVLIDASGSQRSRQGQVAIQAYILSEALSNVGIPHRVTSFCTFWIIRCCIIFGIMTQTEQKTAIFLNM